MKPVFRNCGIFLYFLQILQERRWRNDRDYNNALDKTMYYEYDRHSKHQKRDKNEIGIHSIRGGNIVGEHTVKFISDNECFEITHTAFSRALFADGALKAGEFIVLQDPGLYDMNNLL